MMGSCRIMSADQSKREPCIAVDARCGVFHVLYVTLYIQVTLACYIQWVCVGVGVGVALACLFQKFVCVSHLLALFKSVRSQDGRRTCFAGLASPSYVCPCNPRHPNSEGGSRQHSNTQSLPDATHCMCPSCREPLRDHLPSKTDEQQQYPQCPSARAAGTCRRKGRRDYPSHPLPRPTPAPKYHSRALHEHVYRNEGRGQATARQLLEHGASICCCAARTLLRPARLPNRSQSMSPPAQPASNKAQAL